MILPFTSEGKMILFATPNVFFDCCNILFDGNNLLQIIKFLIQRLKNFCRMVIIYL